MPAIDLNLLDVFIHWHEMIFEILIEIICWLCVLGYIVARIFATPPPDESISTGATSVIFGIAWLVGLLDLWIPLVIFYHFVHIRGWSVALLVFVAYVLLYIYGETLQGLAVTVLRSLLGLTEVRVEKEAEGR